MMSIEPGSFIQKRSALLAQIAAERAVLARHGAALRPAAHLMDKVSSGIRYVNTHPEILLLPATVLALWRPRRLVSFAVSGIGMWRLLQRWRHRLR